MMAVITKELAIKAVLHGACRLPEIGQQISKLSFQDLNWVEDAGFMNEEDKKTLDIKLPLWVLSDYYGFGSGYGTGYGSGARSGYGTSDGTGAGSDSGYGTSDGTGTGAGSGTGSGYGTSDGTGTSDGSGYGTSDGSGYGTSDGTGAGSGTGSGYGPGLLGKKEFIKLLKEKGKN